MQSIDIDGFELTRKHWFDMASNYPAMRKKEIEFKSEGLSGKGIGTETVY